MNAKALRDKFEADMKDLQTTCPHKEKSDWMEYQFSPGYINGWVKICTCCEKVMETYESRPLL